MSTYTDLDTIKERIAELESLLEDTSVMPNLVETTYSEELDQLTDFIKTIEINGVAEDFADALLEHFNWHTDPVEAVQTVIQSGDYYAVESVEEFGKQAIYDHCPALPDYVANYIDFETVGRDLLQNESDYFELADGTLVILPN